MQLQDLLLKVVQLEIKLKSLHKSPCRLEHFEAGTDVSTSALESDPSIEQIVRDDLLAAVADKIEDVAIEGGGSNEPTGITQTSGIGSCRNRHKRWCTNLGIDCQLGKRS